jgi:hypothetical protein
MDAIDKIRNFNIESDTLTKKEYDELRKAYNDFYPHPMTELIRNYADQRGITINKIESTPVRTIDLLTGGSMNISLINDMWYSPNMKETKKLAKFATTNLEKQVVENHLKNLTERKELDKKLKQIKKCVVSARQTKPDRKTSEGLKQVIDSILKESVVLTPILNECQIVFDNSWEKEVERRRRLYESFKTFENEEEFCIHKYGKKRSRLGKVMLSQFIGLVCMFAKFDQLGFDKVNEGDKEYFYLLQISYLAEAISKYTTEYKTVSDISVYNSPKGFVIDCILDNTAKMRTTCVSAGGYNIQRFHYRYLTDIT